VSLQAKPSTRNPAFEILHAKSSVRNLQVGLRFGQSVHNMLR